MLPMTAPAQALVGPPATAQPNRIKVPTLYEDIMRWLATHPGSSIKEGARFFGKSPGWFATVVNSDLFIARYQEWMAEMDQASGIIDMVAKVRGVAAQALEKLSTTIEDSIDPEVILRASDILLKQLRAPSTTVNITGNVDARQLYALDPRLAAIQATRSALLEAAGQPVAVSMQRHDNAEQVMLLGKLEVAPQRPQTTIDLTPRHEPGGDLLAAFDDV